MWGLEEGEGGRWAHARMLPLPFLNWLSVQLYKALDRTTNELFLVFSK